MRTKNQKSNAHSLMGAQSRLLGRNALGNSSSLLMTKRLTGQTQNRTSEQSEPVILPESETAKNSASRSSKNASTKTSVHINTKPVQASTNGIEIKKAKQDIPKTQSSGADEAPSIAKLITSPLTEIQNVIPEKVTATKEQRSEAVSLTLQEVVEPVSEIQHDICDNARVKTELQSELVHTTLKKDLEPVKNTQQDISGEVRENAEPQEEKAVSQGLSKMTLFGIGAGIATATAATGLAISRYLKSEVADGVGSDDCKKDEDITPSMGL